MSRTSRTPVTLGLTAAALAVAGLAILLHGTYIGVRDAHVVRYLYPTLTPDAIVVMAPAALLAAGLLVGVGLVLARKDAGRAALVWLSGVGSVVVLVLFAGHVLLLRNWDFDVWIGPPAWVSGIGVLLAVIALAGVVVSLSVPSARQAFAPAGPQPRPAPPDAGPPAPLRAAASRFAVGGVLGLGGSVLLISGRISGGTGATAMVALVVLAGFGLAAVTAGAYLAARAAGRGSPNGVHLARIAGVMMLLLQVLSLYLGTGLAVTDLYPESGDSDGALFGTLMLATVVAGVAATLGGFAGLADPRSVRFLRPVGPAYQGWDSWTAAGPRSADDPAPAGGYTVP
ncbi:hypothetical protein AB0K00_04240 [Dactylosporangium sp. NPDC049525]|uniref:hypothetical protein n=1 Tax=Dactylosporangium sp. NPDC049525 TaxID=3154730 RepID=UPI00342F5709